MNPKYLVWGAVGVGAWLLLRSNEEENEDRRRDEEAARKTREAQTETERREQERIARQVGPETAQHIGEIAKGVKSLKLTDVQTVDRMAALLDPVQLGMAGILRVSPSLEAELVAFLDNYFSPTLSNSIVRELKERAEKAFPS